MSLFNRGGKESSTPGYTEGDALLNVKNKEGKDGVHLYGMAREEVVEES